MLERFKKLRTASIKNLYKLTRGNLKGFTLAEMMVVMLVLCIILAAAAPTISKRVRATGADPQTILDAIKIANNASAEMSEAYKKAQQAASRIDVVYTRLDETMGMVQDAGSTTYNSPGTYYFPLPPGITKFQVSVISGSAGGGGGGSCCGPLAEARGCGGSVGGNPTSSTSGVYNARVGTILTVVVGGAGGGGSAGGGDLCNVGGGTGQPGGESYVSVNGIKIATSGQPSGGGGGGAGSRGNQHKCGFLGLGTCWDYYPCTSHIGTGDSASPSGGGGGGNGCRKTGAALGAMASATGGGNGGTNGSVRINYDISSFK